MFSYRKYISLASRAEKDGKILTSLHYLRQAKRKLEAKDDDKLTHLNNWIERLERDRREEIENQ